MPKDSQLYTYTYLFFFKDLMFHLSFSSGYSTFLFLAFHSLDIKYNQSTHSADVQNILFRPTKTHSEWEAGDRYKQMFKQLKYKSKPHHFGALFKGFMHNPFVCVGINNYRQWISYHKYSLNPLLFS